MTKRKVTKGHIQYMYIVGKYKIYL